MPFSFQAVQTLRITPDDRPNIDVQDGNLVLTATRGEDRIMITAPIQSIIPPISKITTKTSNAPKRKKTRNMKLNEDAVRHIRAQAENEEYLSQFPSRNAAYEQLAKDHKIHWTTVYGIVRRRTWRNI